MVHPLMELPRPTMMQLLELMVRLLIMVRPRTVPRPSAAADDDADGNGTNKTSFQPARHGILAKNVYKTHLKATNFLFAKAAFFVT